jgi:hypothetical protein
MLAFARWTFSCDAPDLTLSVGFAMCEVELEVELEVAFVM